jgi:hypothetical protein
MALSTTPGTFGRPASFHWGEPARAEAEEPVSSRDLVSPPDRRGMPRQDEPSRRRRKRPPALSIGARDSVRAPNPSQVSSGARRASAALPVCRRRVMAGGCPVMRTIAPGNSLRTGKLTGKILARTGNSPGYAGASTPQPLDPCRRGARAQDWTRHIGKGIRLHLNFPNAALSR